MAKFRQNTGLSGIPFLFRRCWCAGQLFLVLPACIPAGKMFICGCFQEVNGYRNESITWNLYGDAVVVQSFGAGAAG